MDLIPTHPARPLPRSLKHYDPTMFETGPANYDAPETANTQRALWAAEAVVAMGKRTGLTLNEEDAAVENGVRDLLGNLAHFCDAVGLDAAAEFERALGVYGEEVVVGL